MNPSNLALIIDRLREWGACAESRAWLAEQNPDDTLQELWNRCEWSRWLCWFVEANYDDLNMSDAADRAYRAWARLPPRRTVCDAALADEFRRGVTCPDLSRFGIR